MTATLTDPRPSVPMAARNRRPASPVLLIAGGVGAPDEIPATFLDRALGLKETS
jgi:hypothetical protein